MSAIITDIIVFTFSASFIAAAVAIISKQISSGKAKHIAKKQAAKKTVILSSNI